MFNVSTVYIKVIIPYSNIVIFLSLNIFLPAWMNGMNLLKKLNITEQSSRLYLFFTILHLYFLHITWKIYIHAWYNFNDFESNQILLLANLTI